MKRFVLALPLAAALAACGSDSNSPGGTKPALTGIMPSRGTVGTEVRLDGTAFSAANVRVFFNALESPSVETDGNAVFARAPEGLVTGTTYSVAVVNDGGKADTLANAFTAVAPEIDRVNGATLAMGLVGMTVIIEGAAYGNAPGSSKVFFSAANGAPIEAVIADSANDWTDSFVVTSVPQNVGDTSWIWIETPTGVSDSVEFRLIQSGTFSPSLINWTGTTVLPQPLQGHGAVFVQVEAGAAPASYVFVIAGADTLGTATTAAHRATVAQSGAIGGWTSLTALPEPRAYAATAAATPFTAALDTATTAAVVYVVGGVDAAGTTVATSHFARVDLAGNIDAWQNGPSLPVAARGGSAAIFRGYLYFAGGADAANAPSAAVYRAPIATDGSLGAWEATAAMPVSRAHFSLVNFGPFLYAVGGETGAVSAVQATTSGTETAVVHLSRINLRTGALNPWTPVSSQAKARSKHSTVFAGGALLTTSGVYSGQPGSSENTYATVNNDGTLGSWNGATGSETIEAETGISVYNQAAITFIDGAGAAHVLVLGGANRVAAGQPTASVLYY